jgi:putative ABC transport system ATP-binding protein
VATFPATDCRMQRAAGASRPTPLIRLERVKKVFRTPDLETRALWEIELDIHAGEFIAIAGPSGCGKSSLLAILGLLETPTGGRHWLEGQSVGDLSARDRARIRNRSIGFIFQNFNLIGNLTVQENVELPLSYRGMRASERRKSAAVALEMVGMTARARHFPRQLSGGQQQRVAVARAVVTRPSLVLADEPTGNLDSHNSQQVMSLLANLHTSGATICMVTHDPRLSAYATRTVSMFDGQIVKESTAEGNTSGAPHR